MELSGGGFVLPVPGRMEEMPGIISNLSRSTLFHLTWSNTVRYDDIQQRPVVVEEEETESKCCLR